MDNLISINSQAHDILFITQNYNPPDYIQQMYIAEYHDQMNSKYQ